jgi:hypothetical protein
MGLAAQPILLIGRFFGNTKYALTFTQIRSILRCIPCPLRDVSRSSRHVGRGRRWTRRSQAQRLDFERNQGPAPDEGKPRTAKSCGPGAATLALPAGACSRTTGARKAASPGRVRISRKTIARGRPGCLGCTCSLTRVLSFTTFAHGTAGAVGARPSLRPLFEGGRRIGSTRAKSRRENAIGCLKTESVNSVSSRRRPGAGRDP